MPLQKQFNKALGYGGGIVVSVLAFTKMILVRIPLASEFFLCEKSPGLARFFQDSSKKLESE